MKTLIGEVDRLILSEAASSMTLSFPRSHIKGKL